MARGSFRVGMMMELFRKVTGYGEAERRVEILWGVRESGVLWEVQDGGDFVGSTLVCVKLPLLLTANCLRV